MMRVGMWLMCGWLFSGSVWASSATHTYASKVAQARVWMESVGGLDKARDLLLQAVAQEPTSSEGYRWLGLCEARLEHVEQSQVYYEKAVALGLLDRAVVLELGSVYDLLGKYAEASALYARCLALHPKDEEIAHERALSLLLLGKSDEALGVLKPLYEAHPSDPVLKHDVAYAYVQTHKYGDAVKVLAPWVESEEVDAQVWCLLAQAYLGQKMHDKARVCVTRALEKDPKHPQALRLQKALFQRLGG